MKLERIQTIQRLPIGIEEAWNFFTSPQNLSLITPPWLDFRLTLSPSDYLHPGTIYGAQIRPFPGISLQTVTEITHMRPPNLFITLQRTGPFKLWHHEHHFKEHAEGVEIEDIVHYGMHMGPVGVLVHDLLIRKKLHDIFTFRAHALERRFGSIRRQKQAQQPARPPSQEPSSPRLSPEGASQAPRPRKQPPPQPSAPQDPQDQPPQKKTITLEDIFGGTPDDS